MNTMTVKHLYSEPGYCRELYQVVEYQLEDQEPVRPKFLIVCSQDEGSYVEWYTTTSDGDYNEPETPLKRALTIQDEQGNILRAPII